MPHRSQMTVGFTRATVLGALFAAAACASSPRAVPIPEVTVPPPEAMTVDLTRSFADAEGAFVVLLGNDTLGVERFQRTGQVLEGQLLLRSPRTRLIRYQAGLGPGGRIASFESSTQQLPRGTPSPTVRMELTTDSVIVRVPANDTVRVQRFAARGVAVPWLGSSYALAEAAVRHARQLGRDSVELLQIVPGAAQPTVTFLRRTPAGEWELGYFGDPLRLRVDAAGRVLSVDGMATTQKITVQRALSLDFDRLVADFAARDARGEGLGMLSGRDTVRATAANAQLTVDYGRPFARGREIWGGVVPFGRVWRTGANAATHLTTTRELEIGGTRIPAGTYTLWTIPHRDRTQLIINRNVGQWGTNYDQAGDVARIDVRRERLASPVEQFTIRIEPGPQGGVMRMMWDTEAIVVPFTVR